MCTCLEYFLHMESYPVWQDSLQLSTLVCGSCVQMRPLHNIALQLDTILQKICCVGKLFSSRHLAAAIHSMCLAHIETGVLNRCQPLCKPWRECDGSLP